MRKLLPILWVMLCALPMSVSAQQIFIWQGGTSSNWNTGSNWLTFGMGVYPNNPTDIAIVIPAPNNPTLMVSDIVVGSLITTFGSSINLGGLTLTIGSGNITSSTVAGGRIVHNGTTTLNVSGSTFDNIIFDKNGSGITNFQNGNTINFSPGNHIRMLSGAGAIQMGVSIGDSFTGNALFINESSAAMTVGFEGMSTFSGDVKLQQSAMGGIVFGGMGGTSTLTMGSLDASAVTAGTLSLGGVRQPDTNTSPILLGTPNVLDIDYSRFSGNLTATGANTINLILNSEILGTNNTISSRNIANIRESEIRNAVITKSAVAMPPANSWYGQNIYRNCTINNASSSNLTMNTTKPDTFYNQAVFNNTGAGLLTIAASGFSYFDGDITINNTSANGIIVGNSAVGNLTTIAGNIKTTGYNTGPLELSRIDQKAITPNDTLRGNELLVRNSRIRGDFSYLASGGNTRIISGVFDRTNIFRSPNMNDVRQSSFSPVAGSSTTFLKAGNPNNSWTGGNTFGNVNFINSGNGNLSLADTDPDTFNGKATFQQTGATSDLLPCSSANCLFRDTISTLGTTKKIIFGGAASGNAVINGNSAQVLQGAAGLEPEFRRLVMNTTGTLTLNIPLIIVNSSTFTNGIIQSSMANPVIYSAMATSPIGSNASHVDGPIRRSGTGNFRFVTGDNGQYAPVEILPTGTFGTFEVQYFNSAYSSATVDVTLARVSACEYWDISRPGAGDPVNITMTWDDIRSCGIDNTSFLSVAHFTGGMWTNMLATVMGGPSSGTISVSGVSSFSPFTLASTSAMFNPLPIELLYFDARPNGKVVNLHWATATEQNNDYFSIERSRDGLKFEEILRTPGAGNSSERKDYSEVDTRPLSGLSYYRLRQTDFNGESTVSQIVAVQMDGEGKDIKVFPNPADDFFFVETGTDPSNLRIRLLNHIGQTVPLAPQVQAGRLAYNVRSLPAGVYYIEVQQDNSVQSHKVIVR